MSETGFVVTFYLDAWGGAADPIEDGGALGEGLGLQLPAAGPAGTVASQEEEGPGRSRSGPAVGREGGGRPSRTDPTMGSGRRQTPPAWWRPTFRGV